MQGATCPASIVALPSPDPRTTPHRPAAGSLLTPSWGLGVHHRPGDRWIGGALESPRRV